MIAIVIMCRSNHYCPQPSLLYFGRLICCFHYVNCRGSVKERHAACLPVAAFGKFLRSSLTIIKARSIPSPVIIFIKSDSHIILSLIRLPVTAERIVLSIAFIQTVDISPDGIVRSINGKSVESNPWKEFANGTATSRWHQPLEDLGADICSANGNDICMQEPISKLSTVRRRDSYATFADSRLDTAGH